MVSYHILTLLWPYIYIQFRVRFSPSKYTYECQKLWPYWIVLAWVNFVAPIACITEGLGALYRILMAFLTCGYFKKTLPDMLAVEWYYGDAGLDYNDQYICVLTQLPRKIALQQNHWASFDIISDKEDSN